MVLAPARNPYPQKPKKNTGFWWFWQSSLSKTKENHWFWCRGEMYPVKNPKKNDPSERPQTESKKNMCTVYH